MSLLEICINHLNRKGGGLTNSKAERRYKYKSAIQKNLQFNFSTAGQAFLIIALQKLQSSTPPTKLKRAGG
jgi:hypothetical protein